MAVLHITRVVPPKSLEFAIALDRLNELRVSPGQLHVASRVLIHREKANGGTIFLDEVVGDCH